MVSHAALKGSMCSPILVMKNVLILNIVIQYLALIRPHFEISFKPSLLAMCHRNYLNSKDSIKCRLFGCKKYVQIEEYQEY